VRHFTGQDSNHHTIAPVSVENDPNEQLYASLASPQTDSG